MDRPCTCSRPAWHAGPFDTSIGIPFADVRCAQGFAVPRLVALTEKVVSAFRLAERAELAVVAVRAGVSARARAYVPIAP